jgi:acetoin utilization deacetylase AcuC-like enzyme
MAHSQHHHFLSLAEEAAETVILPTEGHNRMGCFTDQVKLTCTLVQDLDEAVKEVKLLGEHEDESSQKITKLEALCKKLREDTQSLEEEKATLEEMVESHDELLMENTRERMKMRKRKKGMLTTEEKSPHPLLAHHHLRHPLTPCLRRSTKKALWR